MRRPSIFAGPRPPLESLPIPDDVAVEHGWTASMREMADHIGARPTLLLSDKFGGLALYIPERDIGWHVGAVIGDQAAAILCEVYGREMIDVALGKSELFNARAAPLIAALRLGTMSYSEAAFVLHTRRDRLWKLAHRTGLGRTAKPLVRCAARDPRQLELLGEE